MDCVAKLGQKPELVVFYYYYMFVLNIKFNRQMFVEAWPQIVNVMPTSNVPIT